MNRSLLIAAMLLLATVDAPAPVVLPPSATARKPAYIPPPRPVKTTILIGAHNCPLWETNAPQMWNQVLKHPERTPALGFYDQANPQVADWETKWAVEHGISFFLYCRDRASKGDAVETRFSSAIEALLKSRYVSKFKFTIMWENQARDASWGRSGISGERDLLNNLGPFWITNYFTHPSYLKIDKKPLLFIYDAHKLASDLGGAQNVPGVFERLRKACREAGFAGLYILGEYRGLDPEELRLRKDMGFDYTFAYCWPIANPAQAIPSQLDFIRKTRAMNIIPEVITVSQGWSGWADEGPLYKIPPHDYESPPQSLPTDLAGGENRGFGNCGSWSARVDLDGGWFPPGSSIGGAVSDLWRGRCGVGRAHFFGFGGGFPP